MDTWTGIEFLLFVVWNFILFLWVKKLQDDMNGHFNAHIERTIEERARRGGTDER